MAGHNSQHRDFPELRERAEGLLAKSRSDVATMTPEEIQGLVHELQVHQIELEMQNEELRRAQAELSAAHERYVDLYDFAPVGYLTLGLDGRVQAANLAAGTMLSRPHNELIGHKLSARLSLDDRNAFDRHLERVRSTNMEDVCEFRVRLRNGDPVCLRATTVLAHDLTSGADTFRTVLFDDTTLKALMDELLERTRKLEDANARSEAEADERRQAESDLAAAELRYRSILDTAAEAIITVDDRGRILSFNRAAQKTFGYETVEIVGRNINALMPEPDHSSHDRYLRRYLKTREPRIIGIGREVEGKRKNGEIFPADLSISELQVAGRTMFTGVIRDISDRKEAERLLVEERDRAQRYLDVAGVMFVELDTNGAVNLVNPKVCEVLGYPREEILGKIWFKHFLPRRERAGVREVFRQIIRGQASAAEYHENPVLTKSGEERVIQWHNTVLRDPDGVVVGTLASGLDVTEQRRHDNELRRLQKEVVDAATLEQQHLGQELHDDAGQQLRGLAFFAGSLSKRLSDGGLRNEAEAARRIEVGLEQTLKAVRALARGLITAELDEEAFLNALADLAAATESRHQIRCEFAVSCDAPFPVQGVRTQLFRIAQEAVANAVRHAYPRHIQLVLTEATDFIRLEIRDNGKGFDSGAPAGQGLGLRIMRHRAELIGGSLTVASELGAGATVTCNLRV